MPEVPESLISQPAVVLVEGDEDSALLLCQG
jgi:hypothetical protein